MKVPFILSLHYKERIEAVCKPLAVMGLKHFAMYLVFNDGSTFILSNVFHILKDYYQDELFKEDYTYSPKLMSSATNGYYLCEDKGSVSDYLKFLLTEKYKIHPTYNIVRGNGECTFVFSAIRDRRLEDGHQFYEKTIKEFERFCISFTDAFLDVIVNYNPSYRFSFILSNKKLRDAVIQQGYEQEILLSQREQECVLLSIQGKKPKHIAKDLNISPYTVEQYLKHIRMLLNCESLTEALFECMNRGLIGRLNSFNARSLAKGVGGSVAFARPMSLEMKKF